MAEGAFAPSVLHPAGGPMATRGQWARAILDARGHPDVPVLDQGPMPPGLATRPTDSRLETTKTDAWIEATWASASPTSRSAPRIDDWRDAVRAHGD